MTSLKHQMMQSWRDNAAAWTHAVRDRQIESRRLVTDAAILAAILQVQPKLLLDVGCGEGWLCRAATAYDIVTVGIDASPELIDRARVSGGEFYIGSYNFMPDFGRKFEAIVCNFSLLEEDLDALMWHLKTRLAPQGVLLIQTVHPDTIGNGMEADGWRIEDFAGFGGEFSVPMPWYFRQRQSWLNLLARNGFVVQAIAQPVHPVTHKPLSLLLSCQVEKPIA